MITFLYILASIGIAVGMMELCTGVKNICRKYQKNRAAPGAERTDLLKDADRRRKC